jgi:Beta-lactamase enzyme family
LRSYRGGVPMRSASLVKAMLLTAELRRHATSGTPLTAADRARLHRMITVSDNAAATATFNSVGRDAVLRLARAAGMRNYSVGFGWGTSQLTASDQARFWSHLDGLLPDRYQAYGRQLMRSISHAQVWGGAPVARAHGYRTMFKSGWLPQPTGWVVHQGLRIERGRCTVGVAVLTSRQPSMAAGITSIRGVVERLI